MRKKLSLTMALVMMLNLVGVFMTLMPVTVVNAETTALLVDDFNGYADIAAMQTAGWTVNLNNATTPPGSPALVTTAAPANLQYLRANASTSATRTFGPVALKSAGGTSPGINAKLVISFDAYTWGGTGSSQAYWKVDDSTSGSVAVAAGRRAGKGSGIYYAKSIPSDFSGLTISTGLSRFTKMKFVINITDSAGAFLSTGPKVDVYCGDMDNPISGGTNVNMIDTGTTKVDRFYIGGSFGIEVDNLDISLQEDPPPTPTPVPADKDELAATLTSANALYATASQNIGTLEGQYSVAVVSALAAAIEWAQDVYDNQSATQGEVDTATADLQDAIDACIPNPPTPTPEPTPEPTATPEPSLTELINDDFNGYADIAAMQAAGWTVNLNSATTPPGSPALVTTAAPANLQYLRAIASTSATRTFASVVLREAGGMSPGINAKLVISYDAYTSGGSGASQDYWKVDDSTSGNVAVAAGRRAGKGSNIYYAKSISSDFAGLRISAGLSRFTKMKFVISITDEYGDFLADGPKVDIYCGDMDNPISGGSNVNMIDTATTKIDRFYIGGSYSSIEVDNLSIGLMTSGILATPEPIPTTPPGTGIVIYNVRSVSTFNSMSIYGTYINQGDTPYCHIKYRVTGTQTWTDGQDLWVDTTKNEFRGSIVYLNSGTSYDIQLDYGNSTDSQTYSFTASTWDETFPEGTVTTVSNRNTTLSITQSGTKNGYNVYEGPATIDVQRNAQNCITINASYIIVRNLVITGSTQNAITINPSCHDVIIEDCTITNWGPTGPGRDETTVYYNLDSASAIISGYDSMPMTGSQRLIIQNNYIGPPAGTSNSWDIGHPAGPQGITIYQSQGNNVIRYNEVIGDDTHHFNDAIGGGQNGGSGNLKCDTDVYGNIASYCYDDAMELEGWNINVRVWNNYTDKSWRTIATAQVQNDLRGPMYIFRNIFGPGSNGGGTATKLQGQGPLYFYHNMFGLPSSYMSSGIHPTVQNGSVQGVTTRNNLFFISSSHEGGAFSKDWRYYQDNTPNDLDYDHFVYNCRNDYSFDQDNEIHGIFSAPTLSLVGTYNYYHTSASNGYNTAFALPGFNNLYDGAGPDTGACEQGAYEFKAGVQ